RPAQRTGRDARRRVPRRLHLPLQHHRRGLTMYSGQPADSDDQALLEALDALLADPAHRDNPLRGPLDRLLTLYRQQRAHIGRLVRISDGYHGMSRHQSMTLADQFDRQVRRLEKLTRISDLYQNNLRELT